MAGITVTGPITPNASQWQSAGVTVYQIAAAAGETDETEIKAKVTLKKHVVVDGRLSADGACAVVFDSESATIDTIQFAARGTARMPIGLECGTNKDFDMQLVDAGNAVAISGWIAVATIAPQESLPQVDLR